MSQPLTFHLQKDLRISILLDFERPGALLHHYDFLTRNTKKALQVSLKNTTRRLFYRYQSIQRNLETLKAEGVRGLRGWLLKKKQISRYKKLLQEAREGMIVWITKSLAEFSNPIFA